MDDQRTDREIDGVRYWVVTRWGGSENNPPQERMREILAELNVSDAEHPDTWLSHESGWTLSVFESGLVVWQNAEGDDEPQHQRGVARDRALDLWQKLSRGEIDAVNREPWSKGYGG